MKIRDLRVKFTMCVWIGKAMFAGALSLTVFNLPVSGIWAQSPDIERLEERVLILQKTVEELKESNRSLQSEIHAIKAKYMRSRGKRRL